MALIQVGIIAKRNMETGEFGPPMPICRELETDQAAVDQKISHDFARIFAKNIGEYIQGTKTK